ncbi:Bystin-domain-containing protein [Rhodocollybia butyracea]|uniref:Bystin-domain-containing protein n=1 Tax=Rhodocollybia butyracea TaxID=206335 RepID=A0A9P5PBS1_9AGAR|nr:Bystin-domain-containing protein [Rhodocollybia butyracea]
MPSIKQNPKKSRHDPLLVQLQGDEQEAKYGHISQPGRRKKSLKNAIVEEDEAEVVLDPKTSRRIFELAKIQQDELNELDEISDENDGNAKRLQRIINEEDTGEESDEDLNVEEDTEEVAFEIDEADMATLDVLLPPSSGERKTLADIIFSKIDDPNAAPTQNVRQSGRSQSDPALGLDPRIVETYTLVGTHPRGYKGGSIPKPFKIIPSTPSWARFLAPSLFLSVVLLDAVRQDIQEHKKLNVHYYEALKRALYKPAAFFKGIVFPMLNQGCTLKEAAIIASILAKVKIPVLHASAALLHIAEMDYTGPNSLFIRVLVDKKFQLPYKVVDALVFHFIRLSNTYKARGRGEFNHLPVLWHQSLLAFVQRYASDLTPDQKDALFDVVRATPHAQIGPEVRRELVNSVVRGAPREDVDEDIEMA